MSNPVSLADLRDLAVQLEFRSCHAELEEERSACAKIGAALATILAQREWQPMRCAPRDRVLLLWGTLKGPGLTELHPQGHLRIVGGWSEIDGEWTIATSTYKGPFFEPSLWAELPGAPEVL